MVGKKKAPWNTTLVNLEAEHVGLHPISQKQEPEATVGKGSAGLDRLEKYHLV